jgi:hypothetical protein
MDHPAREGVVQSFRGLLDGPAGECAREWPSRLHEMSQIDPINELHHQEMRVTGLLGVVGRHDVGMQGQPGGRPDLALESLHRRLIPEEVPAYHLKKP